MPSKVLYVEPPHPLQEPATGTAPSARATQHGRRRRAVGGPRHTRPLRARGCGLVPEGLVAAAVVTLRISRGGHPGSPGDPTPVTSDLTETGPREEARRLRQGGRSPGGPGPRGGGGGLAARPPHRGGVPPAGGSPAAGSGPGTGPASRRVHPCPPGPSGPGRPLPRAAAGTVACVPSRARHAATHSRTRSGTRRGPAGSAL